MEGIDSPIIGKIMVITNLSNYDIVHDMVQDLNTIQDDAQDRIILNFTKEKWVIILAAQNNVVGAKLLSDCCVHRISIKYYFDNDRKVQYSLRKQCFAFNEFIEINPCMNGPRSSKSRSLCLHASSHISNVISEISSRLHLVNIK